MVHDVKTWLVYAVVYFYVTVKPFYHQVIKS